MTEEHDDWLWTGEGPVALELAGIERELRSLAWRPRALVLPATPSPIELRRQSTTERHESSRGWTPLLAGLAAAAAVLALLVWLRDRGEPPAPADPAAHPSGSPSPDLKDPFGNDAPSVPTPVVEQPPEPPSSPDLKDPFANAPDPTPPAPRRRDPSTSPDLKDPFQGSRDSAPSERTESPNGSPDLKDPFSR
jgi:hypothetical protein